MLRKISALLATVLCLGLVSSCVQNPDDAVVAPKDNVTTIPTPEPIREEIDFGIPDLQSSVKLEYTQYTSDSYEFHLPTESDYTMINRISSYQATILGNNSKCEIFEYNMLDTSVKRYIVCTAVDTGTIFFQGEGTVIDINGDNDNEIISNDHLLINTADGIMVANITTAFDDYLQSILPKDAEYEFHLGFDNNYNIFSYTVYTQDKNAYEQHDIQIQLADNRFDFVYENTYLRDIYAPFESNDPDWSVDVSFTDITNPHNIPGFDEYIFKLYTLTLSGPEKKQFKIYGYYDLPLDNAIFINTNEYQDARSQRKLIVHPQYDYALLMYPFAAQTTGDVDKTIAALIDLNTGHIVNSQSGIEEAAFCPYNPYYLFESAEEAFEELNKYDFIGNNIHSITLDVEVISNGFKITTHLYDHNGGIIRSKAFVVDLTTIPTTEPSSSEHTETTEDIFAQLAAALISDEEAIELFKSGRRTIWNWFRCGVWYEYDSENFIYRDYGNWGLHKYYALSKDSYARILDGADIAGNTKIYYGDHEWMQTNLRKIYSERFIETYFAYEYPYPFIYENGIVYYTHPGDGDSPPQACANYTVIHKTENEFAVICEVFGYGWNTYEYDSSKIIGLEYMKFIKSSDIWVIDQCYTSQAIYYAHLYDKIPKEYMEKIPKKYHSFSEYFES